MCYAFDPEMPSTEVMNLLLAGFNGKILDKLRGRNFDSITDLIVEAERIEKTSDRRYESRRYEDRRHEDRRYEERKHEDRKYEERKHEDRKYEDRKHEDKKCNYCKKLGHIEKECWKRNPTLKPKKVNVISNKDLPTVNMALGNSKYDLLVDSGSAVSIVSTDVVAKEKCAVQTSEAKLFGANGQPLAVEGKTTIKIEDIGKHEFIVMNNIDHDGILGYDLLKNAVINNKQNKLKLENMEYEINTIAGKVKPVVDELSSISELANSAVTLNSKQQNQVLKLLQKYSDIFNTEVPMGGAKVTPHVINTVMLIL
jgi:hypothetical protein